MSPSRRALGTTTALLAALGALASWGQGCASAPACEHNSDCLHAYCQDGECKQDCIDSTLDCPKGYTCNLIAQCERIDGGTGGGSSTSSTGPGDPSSTTSDTTTTSTTSTSSTTTSTSSGGGNGTALTPCGGDGDCAAGLVCRALTVGDAPRCTPLCNDDGPCMADTRCLLVGGTSYCAGSDVGRACNAAGDCNFACITPADYCTIPCGKGADCPNGFGCMGIGSPPTSVCVRLAAPCGPGDTAACIAPAACDTSPTLVVGGCTSSCNSAADCPQRAAGLPPWTCDGLCRRPSDVYGPLPGGFAPAQYACDASLNVVNVCGDGQHMDFDTFSVPSPPAVNCASSFTTDGKPGDACLDSCRYHGGCPYGFACAALAGIGNARIGLCMPSGNGEVGAGCSSDTQCAFGYCNNGACSRDCTADGLCPSGSSCVAAGGPDAEGKPFRRCE